MTFPEWSLMGIRAALVVAGIVAWFASQKFLAKRVPTVENPQPLTDGIHLATARFHARYANDVAAGNRLLISSSLVIDVLGAWLIFQSICGVSFRPYLGLVVLFALRQICQVLCPLPPPAGMIWRYPGVPAILVTYGTATDLFFSGHTAIAVYGAAMLGAYYGAWGVAVGVAIAIFEVVTVLVLRAHYTMDVFTGAVCAAWVFSLSGTWAPWVDGLISGLGR